MDHRVWTIPLVLTAAATSLWFLDFDRDGLDHAQEFGQGTHWLDQDTDDDGWSDGLEVRLGTPPRDADADDDGLWDPTEWGLGLDPWVADADADGVLDGDEGHPACARKDDCDQDGLPDGLDQGAFDALDPDSYDLDLTDGVVWLFEQAGQPASRDADRDGIPDAWEAQDGLIQWGAFTPAAGQRDLLVEYLRIEGPASGRFALDFDPAYQAVEDLFSTGGVRLQWIETVVTLPDEHRPGFLDTDDLGFYESVLEQGVGTANPFVTSIVLNPQQTQEDLAGDILGAAFLRSMIATVDYGAHVEVLFGPGEGDGLAYSGDELRMRPVLESHILDARADQVQLLQRSGQVEGLGETVDGRVYFTIEGLTWSWHPEWFTTAPRVTNADGDWYQFVLRGARVDQTTLASTIAHEIGHTLGLCHAHEEACWSEFSIPDQFRRDSTTMSYTAPQGTLRFLQSEWEQIHEYLTCPPQRPIGLVAAGEDTFYAKYEESFSASVTLRACGDTQPIERSLRPDGALLEQGRQGIGGLVAFIGATTTLLIVASLRWH